MAVVFSDSRPGQTLIHAKSAGNENKGSKNYYCHLTFEWQSIPVNPGTCPDCGFSRSVFLFGLAPGLLYIVARKAGRYAFLEECGMIGLLAGG